jgi:tRNA A37 methylthiotransferase MiaB
MKYSVITFGCRVNQADSLGFEEELRARGADAASPDRADLVIVNTCSVTASADQSARQTVRRLARINPDAQVIVTGCSATRWPDQFRGLSNVAGVISNDDKPRVLSLIRGVRLQADVTVGEALTTADRFGDGDGSCGSAIEPGVAGRTAFTLRVQTGCAQPCAYCIIPTTRGAPRSVSVDTVLSEVRRVVHAGFKEIALTGVHLGSYGRDLHPASSLIDLLRALAGWHTRESRLEREVLEGAVGGTPVAFSRGRESTLEREVLEGAEGGTPVAFSRGRESTLEREVLERAGGGAPASGVINAVLFRISSLEPMDCSREIVDLVAEHDCFAPHFHLPLQHASDRMLNAMRRPYTIGYYADLVEMIRARIPAASIGSDVIVGFPGETDEDFDELCGYLERSPLTHVHVFPYSDRPGTAASAMSGKVHGAVIRERASRVREIGRRLTVRFRNSQIGTIHRALTLEDGTLAVTGNYLKLRIPPGRARNEWVQVQVTEGGESMRGFAM